jgi:hypothetical protein
MKFNYVKQPTSIDPRQPFVSRPLIPVRLTYGSLYLETYALLDSGADRSVFGSRFADELKIDLESGKREFYFGIGAQPVPVYHHDIKIQLIGSTRFIEVSVGFTDAPGVDAILGQADFFHYHQIKFEHYKDLIDIKPIEMK